MTREDVFNMIVNHTRVVVKDLKYHDFQPSDRLKDLGANSLDRTDIIEMSMDSLSLDIPRVEVFGARNIGELVEVLYSKLESAQACTSEL